MDQEQAAETLRTVEGMRRRTLALTGSSPYPLIVFATAVVAAAPFCETPWRFAHTAALAAGTAVAGWLTLRQYRSLSVHAARPKSEVNVVKGVILAAAFYFIGLPILLAFVLSLVTEFGIFLALTAVLMLLARHTRNGALALAAGIALFAVPGAMLIDYDHWCLIASATYATPLLAGAAMLKRRERTAS